MYENNGEVIIDEVNLEKLQTFLMRRLWDRQAVGNDDKSRFFADHQLRWKRSTTVEADSQLLTRKPCESENVCNCSQVEITKRYNKKNFDKDNRTKKCFLQDLSDS